MFSMYFAALIVLLLGYSLGRLNVPATLLAVPVLLLAGMLWWIAQRRSKAAPTKAPSIDFGLASERAELLAQWAMKEESSKQHLARELHDEVGSRLASIRVDSRLIEHALPVDDYLNERIHRIHGNCDAISAVLHQAIHYLHPPHLLEHGLRRALQDLIREWSSVLGRDTRVSGGIDASVNNLPDPLKPTVYRMVQEALTNAVKYSKASEIQVQATLDFDACVFRCAVIDNGIGMDTQHITEGDGIRGMRDRVSIFGGALTIESSPEGTRVACEIPVAS